MRIGLVSPYSFEVPGGVQLHVQELAEHLIGRGHDVSVLAPAERSTDLPRYAVSAGRAVPVRYNGSVARLAFGPSVAARVREWVDDHAFEVVHIHEPASPSVSLLALWAVSGPVVATFHSSQIKSRTLRLASPMLQPGMDKVSARIAVSREAQRTVEEQLGAEALVIPNGVDVARFARTGAGVAPPGVPQQRGGPGPWLLFLGRFEEPRKGLSVLLDALPLIQLSAPNAQVIVAGPGRAADVRDDLPRSTRDAVHFVGPVTEPEKVALLRACDLYVAPNSGGESFGIILIEALSAGAPVVASDLPAFADVLGGRQHGALFAAGDHRGLADEVVQLWRDPARRAVLAQAGPQRAARFDWSRVAPRIEAVYDSVRPAGGTVGRHVPVLRRRRGRAG